jgi:hypothetical protein
VLAGLQTLVDQRSLWLSADMTPRNPSIHYRRAITGINCCTALHPRHDSHSWSAIDGLGGAR